jgi:hypothetical protein
MYCQPIVECSRWKRAQDETTWEKYGSGTRCRLVSLAAVRSAMSKLDLIQSTDRRGKRRFKLSAGHPVSYGPLRALPGKKILEESTIEA